LNGIGRDRRHVVIATPSDASSTFKAGRSSFDPDEPEADTANQH